MKADTSILKDPGFQLEKMDGRHGDTKEWTQKRRQERNSAGFRQYAAAAKSLQSCPTVCHPCQAPLSMGFSRQEYWSGLPCPSPGKNTGVDCHALLQGSDSIVLCLKTNKKPEEQGSCVILVSC